ncbi:MAG: pyrroline-5-carboxylate reductase [Candidatus Cryptobacteroides sp.]
MKITIIGSGNMGGAIARALARKGFDVTCTARSSATLDSLAACNPKISVTTDNAQAAAQADVVLIAVKPWQVQEVLSGIRPVLKPERQIIVSIAAGVTFGQMEQWLRSEDFTLFRAIPNTAVEIGRSVSFIASGKASSEQVGMVEALFSNLGLVISIDEGMMQPATALASCGIAYAMEYIQSAAEAGVSLGFSRSQALSIVEETVAGAAALLQKSAADPSDEIRKVTTPGGMTEKGLRAMAENGFSKAVSAGLKASLEQ